MMRIGAASLCFLLYASTALAAQTQNSVLAIYTGRSDLAANILVDQTIRSTLIEHFDVRLDFQSEYIEVSSFSQEAYPALRDYLRRKYAGVQFDIVVAVASDAARFVRESAVELFPNVPIILYGGRDVFENWGQGPPVTGVLEPKLEDGIKGGLELILKLQPGVQHVFVISGASFWDREREATTRQELGQRVGNIAITYLSSLTIEDLEQRVQRLPRESAILFLTMNEDGAGKRLVTGDVVGPIAQTANAPVYALAGSRLGSGIVASVRTDQETMARETAEIIQRLLQGELIRNIPVRASRRASIVDWRQLKRWNIDEDRVPPGADVRFKEPPLWDLYKWHIIAAISLCSLEALLIVALLIQKTRRKRAEAAAVRHQALLQSTMDALDAHVALLDEDANILAVNERWRRYAEAHGYVDSGCGVGRNYLQICESSVGCEEAHLVSEGIRALMNGERESLCCVYPCSDGTNESWFQLRANRFLSQGVLRLVLAHENVTEIKQAHDIQQQFTGMLLRAQDEERRRIARDLHDGTVQNLAAIKMDLTRVMQIAFPLDVRARTALAESISICDQVIKELRTLSYLLHPPLIDEMGLVAALKWYLGGFVQRSGIQVDLHVAQELGRLPSDVEVALFRVVQESLTNIHRHSGGHSAVLRVTKVEGQVVLQIQDDGHGMTKSSADEPHLVQSSGVGILGMRQRLKQLGGRLEIESDANGTAITARAPIVEESYAAHSGSR